MLYTFFCTNVTNKQCSLPMQIPDLDFDREANELVAVAAQLDVSESRFVFKSLVNIYIYRPIHLSNRAPKNPFLHPSAPSFRIMAADTKSENGNASETTVTVDHTAYPPSPGPSEKPAVTLTPAQAEMHKKVLEHFQNESYKLPGVQDSDGGELKDEEKFWLVRFRFLSLSFFSLS